MPETYVTLHPELAADFEITADEGAFDYLYELRHLAEMSGPLLRKKRNLVRQFERLYPDRRIEPVTAANLDETLALAVALNRKLHHTDFLDEENISLEQARKYFEVLEMGGLLLRAAGEAVGFSLYSRMNSDTYDIHFEKADHTVKGAPQFLTAKLAEHLLADGGVCMNREQDMGEPGLRQAKRSLDPSGFVKRHFLQLRQAAK